MWRPWWVTSKNPLVILSQKKGQTVVWTVIKTLVVSRNRINLFGCLLRGSTEFHHTRFHHTAHSVCWQRTWDQARTVKYARDTSRKEPGDSLHHSEVVDTHRDTALSCLYCLSFSNSLLGPALRTCCSEAPLVILAYLSSLLQTGKWEEGEER